MPYLFVSVEGCDGAGKTSIRKFLFRALGLRALDGSNGMPLTITRYGYLDVDHTRVLTEAKWHRRSYRPEELLAAMVGDKQALSRRLIVPHLRHRHVIADRFVVSDLADNQVLRDIPFARTHAALRDAGVRMPDVTLYVSTPPEVAAERKAGRTADNQNWWDRLEIQRRLHAAFEELCSDAPPVPVGRVLRVDNSGSQQQTFSFLEREVIPELRAGVLSESRADQGSRGDGSEQ